MSTHAPSESASEELLIEPGGAQRRYWHELWRYRELLGVLAWRDLSVRYRQAVLGVAWVVIQPAVQTLLLTFVFSTLARMSSGAHRYVLVVITGQLAWQLFATALNGVGSSLVGNAPVLSKVHFPRLVLPLSALGVALVDLVILLALTATIGPFLGLEFTWRILLLPLFVVLVLVIAFGAGLWIAVLTVKYRDFRFVTPFLLQIGLFVTPIGFRTDILPRWREWLALNPLTSAVDGFRWCLLGGEHSLHLPGLAVSVAVAALLFKSGLWFFRRSERSFVDVI